MNNKLGIGKREKLQTIFLYTIFALYLLCLIKLLFLSRISFSELLDSQRVVTRAFNLVPFHTITDYLFSGTENAVKFSYANIQGNIAAFLPLGAFLVLFRNDKRIRSNLLIVAAASLTTELIHAILGIGVADIDDLILNTLGGLLGILGYKLLRKFLRSEKNVRIAVTAIGIIGLPYLYFVLFVVQLRL